MKITLVITTLSSGGAERVLILLAKGLKDKGHNVTVITFYGEEHDFYSLPKGVTRLSLNLGGHSSNIFQAVSNNLNLIKGLREAILESKPDVVIPFMDRTNVITLISMIKSKIPVIVTEHSDPSMIPIGRVWSMLRRMFYPLAQMIVCVSEGVERYYAWINKEKRLVIYNPLPEDDLAKKDGHVVDFDLPFTLIGMGRLGREKGFDLLIKAFARVKDKYAQWQLVILGEGQERSSLEQIIKELNLEDRVKLPGRLKNPFPTLRKANVFVLSSRFEGFGNVIIEAMACGLPVVATDCPSGPGEIIQDGKNGILVKPEDIDALASGLELIMSDEKKRDFLKRNALVSVKKYSLENIIEEWEEVLKNAVKA